MNRWKREKWVVNEDFIDRVANWPAECTFQRANCPGRIPELFFVRNRTIRLTRVQCRSTSFWTFLFWNVNGTSHFHSPRWKSLAIIEKYGKVLGVFVTLWIQKKKKRKKYKTTRRSRCNVKSKGKKKLNTDIKCKIKYNLSRGIFKIGSNDPIRNITINYVTVKNSTHLIEPRATTSGGFVLKNGAKKKKKNSWRLSARAH